MDKYPDALIERLSEEADLVDIISQHTKLIPAGKEFKGCCPFHGEKTPSFFVNPQKNFYHCFGCGVSGNAITFLKEYEQLTFQESLERLSAQTGIALPKLETPKVHYKRQEAPIHSPDSDHTDRAHQTNETDGDFYELLERVCCYFQNQLGHPTPSQYLASRGVTPAVAHRFRLGYAPEGWSHLGAAFSHDIQGLLALGLVKHNKDGHPFDFFRNRLIFPILSKRGRVVGFAGRAFDDQGAKYMNSPESVVFDKGRILYGLSHARDAKAAPNLVVEGYMDVIALHQAGIYNAVAPMGTAINEGQLASLFKYQSALTLCFDGDEAGQKAAMRTLQTALPILHDGRVLKFLTLPDAHDPDTYIQAFGAKAMQEALEGALPLSDYLFNALASKAHESTGHKSNSAEVKSHIMAHLKSLLALLPKGSSYRTWLWESIYQKLRERKTPPSAHIKSCRSAIDDLVCLGACLPHLMTTKTLDDLLTPLPTCPWRPSWTDIGALAGEGGRGLVSELVGVCDAIQDANALPDPVLGYALLCSLTPGDFGAHLGGEWTRFVAQIKALDIPKQETDKAQNAPDPKAYKALWRRMFLENVYAALDLVYAHKLQSLGQEGAPYALISAINRQKTQLQRLHQSLIQD